MSSTRDLVSGPAAFKVPGMLAVLACPPPLCPHLEFAVSAVLSSPVSLTWSEQPRSAGALYAGLEWRAPCGTAGRLAGQLRRLGQVCFDVVEAPSPGCDPERYSHTPELGLHRASIAANGDIVVGEAALRALIERGEGRETLARGLHRLLGTAWDEALEPLRQAAHGAPVTWLRRTG
ncbi:DUF3145 domain-containing protein [Frankia sp. Cas3]|uniref:DUF3145 domain-containing protein n=1 Tax=Frankia sp. Cas3 TaxID=3073926 RepID=UPI002AD20994|nr:DUF3145 domain-containing protein [Frankia sp. Cas3]